MRSLIARLTLAGLVGIVYAGCSSGSTSNLGGTGGSVPATLQSPSATAPPFTIAAGARRQRQRVRGGARAERDAAVRLQRDSEPRTQSRQLGDAKPAQLHDRSASVGRPLERADQSAGAQQPRGRLRVASGVVRRQRNSDGGPAAYEDAPEPGLSVQFRNRGPAARLFHLPGARDAPQLRCRPRRRRAA